MKLNKLSVLEANSERLNGTSLRSWMECLLGPICLFSLFLLLSLLTDAQRRNCAVQLSRMHPRQLSLLSSELIKQMPPYPTFYKEQHVIDRSLARKRLYFNFDWLGPPPKIFPLPPKKEVGRGDLIQVNELPTKNLRFNNNIVHEAKDSFFICLFVISSDWGLLWSGFVFVSFLF